MYTAIIVDDEEHCTRRLKKLLNDNCSEDIRVIAAAEHIEEAYQMIISLKPDIVFLDIQIHEHTGFELLDRLPEIDFALFFVTAYQEYAIKAFKFSALDYLLKPIAAEELKESIDRFKKNLGEKVKSQDIKMLLHNLQPDNNRNKKIAIPVLTGYKLIPVEQIIRCKSDANYTIVFLNDKTSIVVARTLKDFEMLLEPYGFIRLHNSHLVNPGYIKEYHKGKGGYVVLEDNSEIEVSVRKKEVLLQSLGLRG